MFIRFYSNCFKTVIWWLILTWELYKSCMNSKYKQTNLFADVSFNRPFLAKKKSYC
jgi:hypothetical protein